MPCVLIVEDDPDVREFMDTLLEAYGYDTMTAENGAVALDVMRHRKPCLVLLDLMMPVMNGWEFRKRQLADPALKDVPVICVTAIFDQAAVAEQLQVRCLTKPVDFPAILGEVARACMRTERRNYGA